MSLSVAPYFTETNNTNADGIVNYLDKRRRR